MQVVVDYSKSNRPFSKAAPAENLDQVEQLLRQVDALDPRLRREFLAAVRQIQSQVDIDRVATMLQQGRVDSAVQYLNTVVSDGAWARVAHEVSAGMLQAIRRMPVSHLTGMDVSFSVTNPKAVQFLQAYEGDLIRELTRDARAAVMEAVRSGVLEGRNPLTTARDVRGSIGLTETQERAVMNYRRALERGDRSNALGRALRDKRFDRAVRGMRRNPLSVEKIDKMVRRYEERYLKYRSETIGRTESIRALSAGNHMRWKQMVQDGKIDADQVTRTWVYTHDSKTRPAHREIPSLNEAGVGLDQPFDTPLGPLLFPGDPNGDAGNTINCRCAVVYRFKYKRPEDRTQKVFKNFHAVEGSSYTAHSASLNHIQGLEGRHRAIVRDQHGNEVYAGSRDYGTSDEAVQEARNHVRQHYMGGGHGQYDESKHPRDAHGHWTNKPEADKKKTKDRLKELSPKSSDYELDEWTKGLEGKGLTPDEFVEQMGFDPKEFGPNVYTEVAFSTGSGTLGADTFEHFVYETLPNGGKRKLGVLEREIDWNAKMADHAYFSLRPEIQGKNIAKNLLAKQVSFYEKHGIEKIHVHANIDVGGYAWAKYGFVPKSDGHWRKIADHVSAKMKSDDFLASSAVEKLVKSDNPKSLWAIADSEDGKDLLLGSDWYGTLNLKDTDTMKRFNAYVRK